MDIFRTENGRIDREKLMILTVASFMGAIGLLAFWGGLTGIDLGKLGAANVAGILAGLTGVILGTGILIRVFRKRS